MKGSRVQAVVQELRGEKIDIVPYADDPAQFVCNAIAPAEVSRVIIDAEGHRMELIVPDDKLSLAIGKKGQNVRLASQLTGWRIDIHSESKIRELEERAKRQIAAIEGVGEALAAEIFRLGWRSVTDVSRAHADELGPVMEIEVEAAATIIAGAQKFLEEEAERQAQVRRETQRRAALTDREKLLEIEGMNEELVGKLADADIHTVEALSGVRDFHSVAQAIGQSAHQVAILSHWAKVWLGKSSPDEPLPDPPPEPSEPDEPRSDSDRTNSNRDDTGSGDTDSDDSADDEAAKS